MKKILVPTDFSESANNALDVALQITKKSEDSLIILIHIIELEKFYTTSEDGAYISASDDEKYKEHLLHKAGERLETYIEQSKAKNIIGKIETGDVVKILLEYVNQENADLLILGTHRTTAYEEMLFGNHSEKIIHSVECPVLTVRSKIENFKADNLVFATGLDNKADNVMEQIKTIQKMFASKLHLVYVNTPAEFYNTRRINEMKEAFIQKHSLEDFTFTIYNDFTIETGIAHFSDDVDADIITIASEHLTDLLGYTISSHTSDVVIDETNRPVLTFSK